MVIILASEKAASASYRDARDDVADDEAAAEDEQADEVQSDWPSRFLQGCARFMLAVCAGGEAQAASCLVIHPGSSPDGPRSQKRPRGVENAEQIQT